MSLKGLNWATCITSLHPSVHLLAVPVQWSDTEPVLSWSRKTFEPVLYEIILWMFDCTLRRGFKEQIRKARSPMLVTSSFSLRMQFVHGWSTSVSLIFASKYLALYGITFYLRNVCNISCFVLKLVQEHITRVVVLFRPIDGCLFSFCFKSHWLYNSTIWLGLLSLNVGGTTPCQNIGDNDHLSFL